MNALAQGSARPILRTAESPLSPTAQAAFEYEAALVRDASERFPHMRPDEAVSLRQLEGWWRIMGDAGLPRHRAHHPGHHC